MERFFRRPWLIVAVVAAITLFFAAQLPRAELDNNNFRFVPKKDPERILSEKIDRTFGSQVYVLVGLERRHGTILDADFLRTLKAYGERVAELPIVGSVNSIVNTDYIGGSSEGIAVEPLVPEGFTGSPEELLLVRDRLMEWELYRRSLVSDDFTATQVLVSLDVYAEDAGKLEAVEAHKAIKKLAEAAGFQGTTIYVTGLPVISSTINDAMKSDLVILIPLVVIAVVGVLYLSFRRLGGIILPLLTVLISAIWAIGAMVLFGVKLSMLSTILPVILVAVGSAYGIHVVSHYYDEMAGKRSIDAAEHRRIIFAVLRKIGRPVFLAALTTFAGFGSLCFTSVVPIFEFGVFASFGVLVAFGIALTLIPALLILRGPGRPDGRRIAGAEQQAPAEDALSRAMADALCAVTRKRRTTLAAALAVVALSVAGISRLVIDNVLVEYFKTDTDIVRSDSFIRERFAGSKSVSVVVSGEKPGDVLRPEVLGAMDGLARYLKANVPEVGKTMGFTDLVKRINQVFNADESPAGLAPAVPAPDAGSPAAETPVFGFGAPSEATEEPAFGFGFSEEAAPAPAPPSPQPEAPKAAATRPLDELALAQALSRAVAASGRLDLSAEELVGQLARATNYRGAAYYEVPTDPARYAKKDSEGLKSLVANYLVLLSGDIGEFADDPLEPRSIRMNVQLRTVGQRDTNRALEAIRGYVADAFPKDLRVEIGGPTQVEGSLNRLVVQSQLTSVASSLLMVFIILAVFYRSAIAGFIGLAPLSISILINFGIMGWTGIKLNIATAMVASIAVGIGIDYTIHYLSAYHHEYLRRRDGESFIRRTFLTSGKAIVFNAASVGAGFAVLAFSQFNILSYLGALIALTMGTSALVSLTVLPVLLELIQPAFIRRPMPFDDFSPEMEESR